MSAGQKIAAGKNHLHSYTLEDGYQAFLEQIRETATKSGEQNGLQGDQLEKAVNMAIEVVSLDLPDDFFGVYAGTFVVHRPSIGEMLDIDNLAARLTDQIPIHALRNRSESLAHMIATLKVVVNEAPPWWDDPLKLHETEPIQVAFWGWKAWVDSFRRKRDS